MLFGLKAKVIVWLITSLKGRDCTTMRYEELSKRKCYDLLQFTVFHRVCEPGNTFLLPNSTRN